MKGLVFIHETPIVVGSGVLRTFAKVDMKIYTYIYIYSCIVKKGKYPLPICINFWWVCY